MSEDTIREIIAKAVIDEDFKALLFSDLTEALKGFEVSEEDVERMSQLEPESFDSAVTELEERASRAGLSLMEFVPTLKPGGGATGREAVSPLGKVSVMEGHDDWDTLQGFFNLDLSR